LEVSEEANIRGQSSGEATEGDIKGNNMAIRGGGAVDTTPCAVVGSRIPGGETIVWVMSDGGFYAQQSFVFRQ